MAMVESREGESREVYLLRVCVEFIDRNDLEGEIVYYDGTACDGLCLKQDIIDTI